MGDSRLRVGPRLRGGGEKGAGMGEEWSVKMLT